MRAQTWHDDGDDIIHNVAHWALVESVAANHSWTSLNSSSGLIDRGMEMIRTIAAHRGIHAGHVVATPNDLLFAMKDAAEDSNVPSARLPMWKPEPTAPPPPAETPKLDLSLLHPPQAT